MLVESAELLTGTDPTAANSFEAPDVVVPRPCEEVLVADGATGLELPPLSFTALSLLLGPR